MKRLLAIAAVLIPIYLFAQGFGSFSHDQPFFASVSASSQPPACDSGEWNPGINVYTYALYDFNCFQQSAGSPITNLTDSATNAINLAPIYTTNYPYITNNSSEINNRRYGLFDGINDNLANSSVGNPSWAGPCTIFMVALTQAPTNATGEVIFDNGANSVQPGGMAQMLYMASTSAYSYTGPSGSETQLGPYLRNTNWVVTEVRFSGATSYIKTNGVTSASGTHSTTTRRVGVNIGSRHLDNTQNAHMKMAWIGFYTNTLDTTTTSNIFYYLTNRFSIQ